MILDFDQNIRAFLTACTEYEVRMLLVGGGAVNFHGYQRHSADLDFWIENSDTNLDNLKKALISIGFNLSDFPNTVKEGLQNVSIKISPVSDLELITRFNPGKTFDEAFREGIETNVNGYELVRYKVISLNDLIVSKIKAARSKDMLDIQELKRINNLKD